MSENHNTLFLVPTGPDYEVSVQTKCSLDKWGKKPGGLPNQARAWGITSGAANLRNWDRMQEDDFLLFYRSGKGAYVAKARVEEKLEPPVSYFRKEIWDRYCADRIYTIKGYNEEFKISRKELNIRLGYSEDFRPKMHWYVGDRRPWKDLLINHCDVSINLDI